MFDENKMTKNIFVVLACVFVQSLLAQKDSLSINPRYLEDQIYIGITYNIFSNTPDGFVQNSLSYGISGGFIKDIPFNKKRNKGMAIGLGYVFDTYSQNIAVNSGTQSLLDDYITTENTYNIKTNSIELPIELRWRTSTLDKYKFWRVYTGISISYLLSASVSGIGDNELDGLIQDLSLEKLQYAYSLSAGYGTWNIYLRYALSPFFKTKRASEVTNSLKMNSFKIGIMFYLL